MFCANTAQGCGLKDGINKAVRSERHPHYALRRRIQHGAKTLTVEQFSHGNCAVSMATQ